MCSMSKCLVYSEMSRRGKSFLKTYHLAVKAALSLLLYMPEVPQVGQGVCCCALQVPTPQRQVSLGQTGGTEGGPRCGASCPGPPGSSVAKLRVFTDFPLCRCAEGERVVC